MTSRTTSRDPSTASAIRFQRARVGSGKPSSPKGLPTASDGSQAKHLCRRLVDSGECQTGVVAVYEVGRRVDEQPVTLHARARGCLPPAAVADVGDENEESGLPEELYSREVETKQRAITVAGPRRGVPVAGLTCPHRFLGRRQEPWAIHGLDLPQVHLKKRLPWNTEVRCCRLVCPLTLSGR